jgi:hypothetical protein
MKKNMIFILLFAISIWSQDMPYRVLVAYTDSVARVWVDPITQIDNMIAHTNSIYYNSQIGQVRAEVVCIHRVNYTESDSTAKDLHRFVYTDGYMDEILDLRDQYQADVCALICAFFTDDHTGQAKDIYARSGDAFFDMVIGCTGSHVFAHEAGHIAGCRHCNNPGCNNNDQYFKPARYCHAKHQPSNMADGWRTVMSNPWLNHIDTGWVIEKFSNPNLSYNGEPLGTVAYENNALLMIQRIYGDPVADSAFPNRGPMANFRITSATLTVNEAIPAKDSRLARATSTINITSGFTVNQGARFTAVIDPNPFGKRIRNDGKPDATTPEITGKTDFNVRLTGNNLVLDYKLMEKAEIILKICNAAGRLVHAAKLGVRQPGMYNQSLQFPMAAGSYYVNIVAGSYQSPKKLIKR